MRPTEFMFSSDVFDRFRPPHISGSLSGSCVTADEGGVLEVTDTLGQVITILVYLPRALIVSMLPPSGSVVANTGALIYSIASREAGNRYLVSFLSGRTAAAKAEAVGPLLRQRRRASAHTSHKALPASPSYRHLIKNVQDVFADIPPIWRK